MKILSRLLEFRRPSGFRDGEVWAYETRPQDKGSTFRVLRVEEIPPLVVVHVEVRDIWFERSDGSRYKSNLAHAPISLEALGRSASKRVRGPSKTELPDGYYIWRDESEGGVFSIPLSEVVECVDQTIRQ
jgi:hypothetical protein